MSFTLWNTIIPYLPNQLNDGSAETLYVCKIIKTNLFLQSFILNMVLLWIFCARCVCVSSCRCRCFVTMYNEHCNNFEVPIMAGKGSQEIKLKLRYIQVQLKYKMWMSWVMSRSINVHSSFVYSLFSPGAHISDYIYNNGRQRRDKEREKERE